MGNPAEKTTGHPTIRMVPTWRAVWQAFFEPKVTDGRERKEKTGRRLGENYAETWTLCLSAPKRTGNLATA
jgi:hypothetical protein